MSTTNQSIQVKQGVGTVNTIIRAHISKTSEYNSEYLIIEYSTGSIQDPIEMLRVRMFLPKNTILFQFQYQNCRTFYQK